MHPKPSSFPHIPSLFLTFRLVYIPASVLSHTGHGLPLLNVALALLATFGMEALARRRTAQRETPGGQDHVWIVVLMLLLLGLFPEEAPIGVILWAGIGALWGRLGSRARLPRRGPGLLAGALCGLTGLFGPGSWLMAGALAVWAWRRNRSKAHD